MAAPEAPASLLAEAQRLLDDRGPLLAEAGAYLESEDLTVWIHPGPSGAGSDGEAGARSFDLVVTVRSRRRPGLLHGLEMRLRHSSGLSFARQLNGRGQALFRGVPAGECRAGLQLAAEPAVEPFTSVVALRRIPRRLPAAAGTERRPIHSTYSADQGRLETEVLETDEARLVVAITAPEHARELPLVRLQWVSPDPEASGQVCTLITPLARTRTGAPLAAKYDLGSVAQAEAIEIAPAEWADPSELTEAMVRQAFGLRLYGNARRAWEQLAGAEVCAPDIQAALRRVLSP